ncbi:MAG TPA: response regulator [Phycisphaerae bacterium]|nr:response regulator [Phycisphaerae bacterium]
MTADVNQPLAPCKVLIVEDNPQNLELLEVYMEDLQPEVTTLPAVNGVEALEMVDRHKPDLILLDIMMPKMSGFEVCRHLKSNPETRDIFVVMITALNETGDIERATECGADDYLTKPVDRKALVKLVRSMLQARQAS